MPTPNSTKPQRKRWRSSRRSRPVRWLALAGFMGVGKSRLGRELSRELGLPFFDCDVMIERAAHLSIPQMFAQQGESVFRYYESEVLKYLIQRENGIVSLGGGAFVSASNRSMLKARGPVVVLHASPETIYERTKNTPRPLLKVPDPIARIRELLDERQSAYAEGDIHVSTDGRSTTEVLEDVLQQLALYRKRQLPSS